MFYSHKSEQGKTRHHLTPYLTCEYFVWLTGPRFNESRHLPQSPAPPHKFHRTYKADCGVVAQSSTLDLSTLHVSPPSFCPLWRTLGTCVELRCRESRRSNKMPSSAASGSSRRKHVTTACVSCRESKVKVRCVSFPYDPTLTPSYSTPSDVSLITQTV